MNKLSRLLLGLMVTLTSLTSASYADQTTCKNLVDYVSSRPDLSQLTAAVVASGLAASLNGPGPITVFAPNDAAFQKAPFLGDLLPFQVRQVLLGHTVFGTEIVANSLSKCSVGVAELYESGLTSDFKLTMANGKGQTYCPYTPSQTSQFGQATFDGTFGGAKLLETDIHVCNGIVHVIDTVLQ